MIGILKWKLYLGNQIRHSNCVCARLCLGRLPNHLQFSKWSSICLDLFGDLCVLSWISHYTVDNHAMSETRTSKGNLWLCWTKYNWTVSVVTGFCWKLYPLTHICRTMCHCINRHSQTWCRWSNMASSYIMYSSRFRDKTDMATSQYLAFFSKTKICKYRMRHLITSSSSSAALCDDILIHIHQIWYSIVFLKWCNWG